MPGVLDFRLAILHSLFIPIEMHFRKRQAWHCLLFVLVMLQSLLYEHVNAFPLFILRLQE